MLLAAASVGCGVDESGFEGFEADGEIGSSTTMPAGDASGTSGGGGDGSTDGDATDGDATGGEATSADTAGDDAGGSDQPDGKRVLVDPGTTNDAELVETLPVGTSEANAKRRVVMRLSAADLPDLAVGDRLITPAEVQVTTRCDVGQIAPGCDYNPHVAARLILTGDPDDTDPAGDGSKALTTKQTLTCTKAEHHCMLVFRPNDATNVLENGFALPCVQQDNCRVNLVMWAWHADARSGGQDKVLVGENEGNYLANGVVGSDKGRLMVVRERNITAADIHERETSGGGALNVPTNTNPKLVYSHPLKAGTNELKKGEQFLVEAKIVTEVAGRARFSTKMFLTKNPDATDGGGLDKTFPTQIGEHNGINCTPGTSPCTTRKLAVFRVTDDIQGTVYVNIVAKSAVPGGGSTTVTVHRNQGWLRSTRYEAGDKG